MKFFNTDTWNAIFWTFVWAFW